MSVIEVTIPAIPAGNYQIEIGAGILSKLWPRIKQQFPEKQKFVVTDSNLVKAGHLGKLIGNNKVPQFIIDPPGETSKNINTVTGILESMEKAQLGRDSLVVALGGGTVGDIAAFAAAIFKRGARFYFST